ncbi:hypothetical protein A9Q99_24930 [Gammaproteobacteria bacterium 45_16_T64]|nr:hypothetical protein A9Q99_24930 [Gammaproteobacteria bacterium 45_16_T64]
MENLQLTPSACITPNDKGVLLRSKYGSFQLHGADITKLLTKIEPMLNGKHNVQTICASLPCYDSDNIELLLRVLTKQGVIEKHTEPNQISPPWSIHERFIKNDAPIPQDSTAGLMDKKVLLIGLEAWSVKIVDELAHCGVGRIHVVDNGFITQDDVTCHREFHRKNIGESRAETLKIAIYDTSPWCEISHERLLLDNNDEFSLLRQEDWDLVINALPQESEHLHKRTSAYLHKHNIPGLYGHIEDNKSWLGPLVIPHETACWNCFRLRKLGATDNPQFTHVIENCSIHPDTPTKSRAFLSPMASLSSQQITMEALKFLLCFAPTELHNNIKIHDLVNGNVENLAINPIPWCDVCSGVHEKDFQIQGSENHHSSEDEHTGTTAFLDNPLQSIHAIEELRSLFSGWVDSTVGAIRNINRYSSMQPNYPNSAVENMLTITEKEVDLRRTHNHHFESVGNGLDPVSAHTDAISEAIQRFSISQYDKSALLFCSASQLKGESLSLSDLPLYSKKQYDSPGFPFSHWRQNQNIHWLQGCWYGTEKAVSVPALLSYQHVDLDKNPQFCQTSFSGLATGQDYEEAAMTACYNLIKHDAIMLTWYAQQPCVRLTLAPYYQGNIPPLIHSITKRGMEIELYLLDIGHHIPVIVCLALGDGRHTPSVSTTLSCHGDIDIAVKQALVEQGHRVPYLCHQMSANTRFPTCVSEVREQKDHAAFYLQTSNAQAFDFMRRPLPEATPSKDWKHPKITSPSTLREQLELANIDIAIIDITPPDVYLAHCSVTRAIGKQLQPIHFGEQFQRSYTARLGKLLKRKPVNPYPHPIS